MKNKESGFAVLFVYAMAATVAIMLYMELPRIAFEAQRDKEQLLIDRGEQYSRAIALYTRKFNKFPADFDALQNTQNLRFLRHKYIDPMTGKDDWRIIHVGPGGIFIDSLVYNKKKDDKQKADQQNFITELQQTGGNQLSGNQQGVNVGTRQRQSDMPGAPGDVNNPQVGLSQPGLSQLGLSQPGLPQPGLPQQGQFQSPIPQFDANGQPIPNSANGTIPPPGTPPGLFQPGINGFPGPVPGGQPFPGGASGQQPGQMANAPTSSAAGLINQILTTPRPGGMNGVGAFQQAPVDQNGNSVPSAASLGAGGAVGTTVGTVAAPTSAAAQTVGGGIAGVASKIEIDGIKVYKDQTSYNKWEFVYDISKDTTRAGVTQIPAAAAPPGTPIGQSPTAAPPAAPPGAMPGTPGAVVSTPGANGVPTATPAQ